MLCYGRRCETFGDRSAVSSRSMIDAGDAEQIEHVAHKLKKVSHRPTEGMQHHTP